MTDKGLLRRDESQRAHIYQPVLDEAQTQEQLVDDLVARAFGGSSQRLLLQLLSAKKASADELAEVRQLLNAVEAGEAVLNPDNPGGMQ